MLAICHSTNVMLFKLIIISHTAWEIYIWKLKELTDTCGKSTCQARPHELEHDSHGTVPGPGGEQILSLLVPSHSPHSGNT